MNPPTCKSCYILKNQVKVVGDGLENKTSLEVFNMIKMAITPGLLHVAKYNQARIGFLHFTSHVMASVFYNKYNVTGVNVQGLIINVQPSGHEPTTTSYHHRGIAALFSTPPPPASLPHPPHATASPPPPPATASPPPPPATASPPPPPATIPTPARASPPCYKRSFCEGLEMLNDDIMNKKARLLELEKELEELEEKKRLAEQVIS